MSVGGRLAEARYSLASMKPVRSRRRPKSLPDSRPKTFSLHWGRGIIEEEVQIETPYHRPTIQLLKFTDGEAAGTYEIRLCHYDHRGRFQRSPLIVDATDMPRLGKALRKAPKLKRLLASLVR
jgi:hypothetical protein